MLWKLMLLAHQCRLEVTAVARSDETMMAQPLSGAVSSALYHFSHLIIQKLLLILLQPFFPSFFNYIAPPPLNFHLHFSWDPNASGAPLERQFKLEYAREATRYGIGSFMNDTLGASSSFTSRWDESAFKNSTECT